MNNNKIEISLFFFYKNENRNKIIANLAVSNIKFINMLRKVLFTLGIAILMGSYAYGQNATLKGKVTETDGKTPVEFANVALMQDGQMVTGAVTGESGNYVLSPIASGTYDLRVSFTGYQESWVKEIVIQGNITKIQDVILTSSERTLDPTIIVAKRPIFEPGDVAAAIRMNEEDIKKLPGKNLDDVISNMSGVTNSAQGMSVRGGRPGEQTYNVDGSVTTMIPPSAAIAEFAFIQGAIPAEYGSVVFEIETKGFSREHRGEVGVRGSVDGFNNVSLNFGFTGPIARRKDMDKTVYIGYMLAGAVSYSAGGNIRGGSYRASQETIDYLIENPLRRVDAVAYPQLDYVTKYQEGELLSLEEKKGKRVQNAWSVSGAFTGKLEIKASKDVDLMLKGGVSYSKGKSWDFYNSLFNSINNGVSEDLRWDVNARLTHRIKTESNSLIQNVYYRLTGYYSRVTSSSYSDLHNGNLFDYGYIGKFDYSRRMAYKPDLVDMEVDGQMHKVVEMASRDVAYDVAFTPFEKNQALANYTLGALNYIGSFDKYENPDVASSIQEFKGLLNGQTPTSSAYGLFTTPGMPYSGYSQSIGEVINPRFAFSFTIKNHNIKLGAEYHQSISRAHSINPYSLWSIMRNFANEHILELDTIPIYSRDEFGRFTDTVVYNRIVNSEMERQFSKSIRSMMNLQPDEWVEIDKYDPSTYSLDMFSPEDLFNNGSNLVSYYGFDYTGKKTTNKSVTMADMENWYNGNANRNISMIGAYKPIRISAYIQDKFAIKSLFFDLGLRLDIYDKNQPIVKDMYLLRDAYTLKEAMSLRTFESDIPSMMQDNSEDYYVYVRDMDANSLVVTAYRKGNIWYNAEGNEIDKPDDLAMATGKPTLIPLLKTGENIGGTLSEVSYNAFADYKPTFANGGIALSPRIAFAFTVAENSKFTASYNIMTSDNNSMLNPITYLYFVSNTRGSSIIGNPGLKPDRSIDYQIGFEQAINDDMKIGFTAYYSEKRDQVQAYHYTQAYPQSYYSYINMDFGTVQGFVLDMLIRQAKSHLFLKGSYTLQFAKGTGSTASSTLTLIRAGLPNLRTLTLLSYDQRHKINLSLSYDFGYSTSYTGPTTTKQIKNTDRTREIKWLEKAGASLTFAAGSGLPYTQSDEPYSEIVGAGQRVVKGRINGSRMPWIFDCNLKIWKGFSVTLKNDKELNKKKMGHLIIEFEISNLFEFDKITSVYAYTGSATDDGYLTAAKYQQDIARNNNVASFQDYYSIRMEGVNRLGAPRTFDLSLRFEF